MESTFTDDLRRIVVETAGADRVTENYVVPGLPGGESYPIDLFVDAPHEPLYVFGVSSGDKARIATIVLQHLRAHSARFNSMVVYSDVDDIPKADQKRLMRAANDAVPSINDADVIKDKIVHRLAA